MASSSIRCELTQTTWMSARSIFAPVAVATCIASGCRDRVSFLGERKIVKTSRTVSDGSLVASATKVLGTVIAIGFVNFRDGTIDSDNSDFFRYIERKETGHYEVGFAENVFSATFHISTSADEEHPISAFVKHITGSHLIYVSTSILVCFVNSDGAYVDPEHRVMVGVYHRLK